MLPAADLVDLIAHVRARFGLAKDAEITVEANPGPDERGDAAAMVAAGVTRLSLGAQSMADATLTRLGRRHRVRHVAQAVGAAREAGIPSISLDLLYDVPGGSLDAWMTTLDAALELAPDHLSLYALTLDDPVAEGLTAEATGDHLPTTAGRPPLARDGPAAPGRGPGGRRVPPRRPSAGRRRLARLRDQQLGAARPREPAQPGVLGATAVRGGRPGRPRLRWRHPALERRAAGWLSGRADPGRRLAGRPCRPAVRRSWTRRRRPRSGSSSACGPTSGIPVAAAHEPPLDDSFGWAISAELVDVTEDDRIVLTTRGRLLSNELFSRLVG